MQESFIQKGTVFGDEWGMGDRESEDSVEWLGVIDMLSVEGRGQYS